MENSNKIVPPHLNAEIYRTDTTGTNNYSFLDYINIHADGGLLIGSSELTGRYWNGGVTVFESIAEAQNSNCDDKRSICLSSGTADGCFIDSSKKVLLCEDSGAVSVWSKNVSEQSAWCLWHEEASVAEHDDVALAVDCLNPGQLYITVGADGNVKIWDINDMICVRNYSAAHSMMIYTVSVRPNSNDNFATGSMDQYVTLWDENIDKPALDLLKNDCCVRCVKWIDDNSLAIGDEAGVLRVVDIRNPDEVVTLTEFPAAVHKLAVHPDCDKVAVCCDNKIVSVCEVSGGSNCKVIYHDRHMHTNYVRGLAWDPGCNEILYSVGWNSEMKSHNVVWD